MIVLACKVTGTNFAHNGEIVQEFIQPQNAYSRKKAAILSIRGAWSGWDRVAFKFMNCAAWEAGNSGRQEALHNRSQTITGATAALNPTMLLSTIDWPISARTSWGLSP